MIDLINGDCLVEMKKIPSGSIDLILCDLPYGTTKNKWDSVIDLELLWIEYKRVVKPNGNILLFGTGLFAYRLALSNQKMFRYDMVWKKSKCGSPLTAKYMPLKKHELILVFGNPAAKYNPILTAGAPYKRKYTPNVKNNFKYGIPGVETDNNGTRHPSTILDFPQKWRRQDQLHPTQKPIELSRWLISAYSNSGDIVLDNCMGSGLVGVACKELGRDFIGIEKDYDIFCDAKSRIIS